MKSLAHVERVTTWDSGGGIVLDLLRLKDGSIIGISAESIVLYSSEEELMGGEIADCHSITRRTVAG
jgi:hypothetical protein